MKDPKGLTQAEIDARVSESRQQQEKGQSQTDAPISVFDSWQAAVAGLAERLERLEATADRVHLPEGEIIQSEGVPGRQQVVAANLPERLERLEATQMIGRLETAMAESKAALEDTLQRFAPAIERLEWASSQVNSISAKLQDTPGYAAPQSSRFSSCSSRGALVARTICTSCGKENPLRWWPGSQRSTDSGGPSH